MIKFASIEHLATEVLSIGAKHGFTTHALNLVRDLLTVHAAPPATDTNVAPVANTVSIANTVADVAAVAVTIADVVAVVEKKTKKTA